MHEAQEEESPEQQRGSKIKTWAPIAVGAGAILLFSGVLSSQDKEPDGEANRLDAVRVCEQDFIPKRLKAPSTADYDLSASGGPTTFTVKGTVDAENSFGAKLRSNVECIVEIEDADRWRLVLVSID